MRLFRLSTLILLALPFLAAAPAAGQEGLDRPLRVYLDCIQFYCEQDFFTEEVPWVDFVRDRQSADVHVLGTRQTTGAGGSAYTLEFQGRGTFEGQQLTLRASAPPDATESERRSELVSVVREGLAPFARATAASPTVAISAPTAADQEGVAAPQEDPWNRWVFRVGFNGFANGESQQRFLSTNANANATRVTEDWKLMLNVRQSESNDRFELPDTTIISKRVSYASEALAVKSLGSHWGAGSLLAWERSTFNNYDHSVVLGGAVEYNVFPYAESNRRLLTIFYGIGPRYNRYENITIFGETEETLIEQMLVTSYDVTQPWGNIDVSARLNHYIAKFGDGDPWPDPQYNATLSGGFDVRLIRGLSTRIHGSISTIRGQIQLSAAELTEEEILTRQRELATNYRYFMSFGLTYRFGSIFSDVINPRFEGI